MVSRRARMEVLRALLSECLSAAAQEIFSLVERAMAECEGEGEGELSCSQWVVDSQHTLLDAAAAANKTHSSTGEDSLHTSATDVQLQCGMSASVCWETQDPTPLQGPSTQACPKVSHPHTDSSLAPGSHQDVTTGGDVHVKQQGTTTPLKILQGTKPFRCPICPSVFCSKKTMVRHMKRHPDVESSSYRCQFCERHFRRKSEFIIHTRTHKFTLARCSDEGYEHRETQAHFTSSPQPASRLQEDSRPHQSGLIKTSPAETSPYDKSEFDQESLQPLCLYQIQTVDDIDKNSASTLPLDGIKSEPGDAVTDSHTTTGEQPLPSLSHTRQQQQQQHTQVNLKRLTSRRASGKSNKLVVQFEVGTALKPYKCPCCPKCFSLTKTLIRHFKIHAVNKEYQCQFCDRHFCQKSDLVSHTRVHTGERPYRCSHCPKTYKQNSQLLTHMMTHTEENPH